MLEKLPYKLSFWETVLLRVSTPIVALLLHLWNRTCRVVQRENEEQEVETVKKYRGCVYTTWHQRMFYFFHDFGKRHVTMMGSLSKDGEYANAVALRLGFYTVRGSATLRGKIAMHELIELLKRREGHTAGMMADGPKGPPRQLKMGTIVIARETGLPVIPMMYGAKRRLVFKSWDRFFLPRPFTDIVMIHGEPVFVPPDADDAECERLRQLVTDRMNEMADRCDSWWGGPPVGKPGYDLPASPAFGVAQAEAESQKPEAESETPA
jgi:lysophospholipid acyltransferase (LPLAT)-like uncharacterized protein